MAAFKTSKKLPPPLIVKNISMINLFTGWFKIVQYNDKINYDQKLSRNCMAYQVTFFSRNHK